MATKLDRMVTYLEGFLPIKSHDPLITWPCKITWQAKTSTSLLSQCWWTLNLAIWLLVLKSSHRSSYSNLQSRSLARSREKLKPLYLCYHTAYSHQTWQGYDLPWGVSTNKDTFSSPDLARSGDKLKIYLHYLNAMASKLCWILTSLEGFLSIKSNGHLIKCLARSRDKLKPYLHYHRVCNKELSSKNSHNSIIRWSCEVTWHIKYIPTCRRPADAKLRKVLTYHERIPPLKPNDPSIK